MSEQGVDPRHRSEFDNLAGRPLKALPYTPPKGSSAVFGPAFASWRTHNANIEQSAALLVDKGEDLV